MFRRILAGLFILVMVMAFVQCARRGSPTGGPKDITPPKLIKAIPENLSTGFTAKKIRLYFDEYITLKDIQEQLIISPPLKYAPIISPMGGASKYVEIKIKDTLKPNTTYTFNFGQSIVDHNEGNPSSYLTYIFSTGTYIDSLELKGAVKDAFNKKVDQFISVMLYEIDSAYNDSTIYKQVPNYITNTLDSTVIFTLKNLKAGKYALFALKDDAKNNKFDQSVDKIGFYNDTITIPTDSTYVLTLFKEKPNYSIQVPSYTNTNKIIFGYYGQAEDIKIQPLTVLPDSVTYKVIKEKDRDTLNFWFTPTNLDSILFLAINDKLAVIDTFKVKKRKVEQDSLKLTPNQNGTLDYNKHYAISANTPITIIDSTKFNLISKDSTQIPFSVHLDSLKNEVRVNFKRVPEENYTLNMLPGAINDFFSETNDTVNYNLNTNKVEDYGKLLLNVETDSTSYPILVQLTDQTGITIQEKYAEMPKTIEFSSIEPAKYFLRIVLDKNKNQKWDTGNYLKKSQAERVIYYPDTLKIRANWDLNETFTVKN